MSEETVTLCCARCGQSVEGTAAVARRDDLLFCDDLCRMLWAIRYQIASAETEDVATAAAGFAAAAVTGNLPYAHNASFARSAAWQWLARRHPQEVEQFCAAYRAAIARLEDGHG